jgi:hypothetical protein
VIFLEQFGLNRKLAGVEQFLQVVEHSFPDTRNCQNLLGIANDPLDLLRMILDGLGGVAVGTNAEGILPIDFKQVGSLVKDVGDGFIVHRVKINKIRLEGLERSQGTVRNKPSKTRWRVPSAVQRRGKRWLKRRTTLPWKRWLPGVLSVPR